MQLPSILTRACRRHPGAYHQASNVKQGAATAQGEVGVRHSRRGAVLALGAVFASACASSGDGMNPDVDGAESELVLSESAEEGAAPGVEEPAVALDQGQYSSLDADACQAEPEPVAADEADVQIGQLEQALGGSCGSQSSTINSVYYYTSVPDHFPPDSIVAQVAALAIGIPIGGLVACLPFGVANMGPTCDAHDACYGTLGKSKDRCDREAKAGWERACKNTYDAIGPDDVIFGFLTGGITAPIAIAEQGCRESCLGMAKVMHAAIAGAGQSAYDAAQFDASRPVLPPIGEEGPLFF